MKIDYYKILGLDRNAGMADVKKAYRSHAMKYHPDRNPDDESSEERFKLIIEAYEILKDREKRDEYDRIVSAVEHEQANSHESISDDFFIPPDEILGDFLRGFFNKQQSSRQKSHDGKNLRHNMRLTFHEAALGVETEIRIPCQIKCHQCDGTGLKAGAKAVVCSACKGRGKTEIRRGLPRLCRVCNGSGALMTGYCNKCNGSGNIQSRRSIPVSIPPGVETGTRLQIKGMGMPGRNGGKAGSLFIVVNVTKHPFFYKQDLNIVCDVPIPFFKAILGSDLEIPTLEGKKRIKIPAGVQTGKEIKLRGKGIRSQFTRKRGDLIVRLRVELPEKISREDRRALRSLEENSNAEHYPLFLKFNKKLYDKKNEN